jgi:Na+/glutamate symporter
MPKQYKVEVVVEGAIGTLFLGASSLPIEKMEEVLNEYGAKGWNMDFMLVEHKRFMLFWDREAAILTFSREM